VESGAWRTTRRVFVVVMSVRIEADEFTDNKSTTF
jgi:hypothetical protein